MPKVKEYHLTGAYVNADKPLDEAAQMEKKHVQFEYPVKEAAMPVFNSNTAVVAANSAIHVPDLSEVSYSDFILYNYGQVYQKQYNSPVAKKLKRVH